jgi:hypothetical protein
MATKKAAEAAFFVAQIRGQQLWRLGKSGLPGIARRLPTFLASPRKVGKRRRPRDAALRVSAASVTKAGNKRNSLRSDNFCFFSAFVFCQRQRLKRMKTESTTPPLCDFADCAIK